MIHRPRLKWFKEVDVFGGRVGIVTQSENKRKRKKKKASNWTMLKNKKLRNVSVTMIPVVIGALRTVHKSLERELDEVGIGRRIENIETAELLRSAKILR